MFTNFELQRSMMHTYYISQLYEKVYDVHTGHLVKGQHLPIESVIVIKVGRGFKMILYIILLLLLC